MHDYLLRYAIDNIWCNPRQDKQFNFKLRRHTPIEGARHSYVVEKERYTLPKTAGGDLWHVFQIGQAIPQLLGIPFDKNIWLPLAKVMEDQLMECEVFTSNGILFPRQETYILLTQRKNLLVAIRTNPRYPDIQHKDVNLYLQIYSPAYFESERSAGRRYKKIFGMIVKKLEDVRQFQIHGLDLLESTGFIGRWFVNGRLVNEVSAAVAGVADYIELVVDGSIREFIDFPLKDLPSFKSKLDNVRKYILHYPGNTESIDYLDDIDAYLYKPRANNSELISGVLYHRNKGNWLRQLTHKDYSIATDTIQAFMAEHPIDPRYIGAGSQFPSDEWNDLESLAVRLYIKHSGYERPLVKNVSRTDDLYRLSSENIIRAMTGADAVAEAWRAENLELSRYVGFMGLDDNLVFPKGYGLNNKEHPNKHEIFDYAADALGYYQASKILSDSPIKATLDNHGEPRFCLSYNFWDDSTVFEYDEMGLLLGYYRHTFGEYYRPHNAECYLVEPVAGTCNIRINGHEGNSTVDLPYGYGFRVYIKDKIDYKWKDITDSDNLSDFGYIDDSDPKKLKWVWTYNTYEYTGYIRIDNVFYYKQMVFNKSVGMIRFNLDCFELVDNVEVNRELILPFGQYDIFLNRRSLVENVDYILKDNRVVINNLEYLDETEDDIIRVSIRGRGFCDSNLNHYQSHDTGFVEYGVLSSNQVFNLHSNKVQRIVADGRLLHQDDVIFDEDNVEGTMQHVRNGSPFAISHPQSVLREVFRDDYAARIKDDKIEKDVTNYLTYYLPKRERPLVDSIDRKYNVLSCSSNLIIHLILTNRIKPVVQHGRLREDLALDAIKPYEWIKRYDILNTDYNDHHIFVYPHWFEEAVGLTHWEYRFYTFLLKQFTLRPLELAPFIYIKEVI